MKPAEFYNRVRQAVRASSPEATVSLMFRFEEGGRAFPVTEESGELTDYRHKPLETIKCESWGLTIFKEIALQERACGTIRLDPRTVANSGPEFADKVAKILNQYYRRT